MVTLGMRPDEEIYSHAHGPAAWYALILHLEEGSISSMSIGTNNKDLSAQDE
jgi:hypothetical protein